MRTDQTFAGSSFPRAGTPHSRSRSSRPSQAAPKPPPEQPAPAVALTGKKGLPQWDCAPGVDYVTIHLNGYERKLTGGEICNPYEDVVREVPAILAKLPPRLHDKNRAAFLSLPTIRKSVARRSPGRSPAETSAGTIPILIALLQEPLGPLPPGEYSFAADKERRVSWGPRTKRNVAGIYLQKLWNKDRFSPQQTAAILARGNIAIHVRLKGEMSEACIGLEPKGLGLCRFVDQGSARHRPQRLYR